jgi:hypothetical protein
VFLSTLLGVYYLHCTWQGSHQYTRSTSCSIVWLRFL